MYLSFKDLLIILFVFAGIISGSLWLISSVRNKKKNNGMLIDNNNTPNKENLVKELDQKRPVAITVVCVLYILNTIREIIPTLFLSGIIGRYYLPYFILYTLFMLICIFYIWRMKKWGIITFTILFISNQVVMFLMKGFYLFDTIISIIVIMVSLYYFSKMHK